MAHGHERDNNSNVGNGNGELGVSWVQPDLSERDRATLRRLGKKPVLKVNARGLGSKN